MAQKLILLELNEVPYRVIDAYCQNRPDSTLARILPKTDQYETKTEDRLALDPWISWSTLHRGVTDETHNILHLGQVLEDVDKRYPPVWRILKERKLKVGVFGSLHSSSLPPDVSDYSFYLPDYFDSDAFAHPKALMAFQELNLAMTRQSARNVTRTVPLASATRFLKDAPSLGLTASTVVSSAAHLVREIFNPALRIRRRSYQPLLMADLFMKQMSSSLPDFATFYTNHVAAAMHRYWGAAFPGDYVQPLDADWVRRYSKEIEFAMDKFDIVLKRLVEFTDTTANCTLIVASSMGQAAIPSEKTYEFLTITDLGKFMAALGVPVGEWEPRPAMVPCQCVVVSEQYRSNVMTALEGFTVHDSMMQWHQRPVAPMSCDERQRGFFQFFVQFDNYAGPQAARLGGKDMRLADIGLGLMAHEDGVNCTAQHVPQGSLLIYRPGRSRPPDRARSRVSTVDVVPSIMKYFGFDSQSYMPGSPSIAAALQ